MVSEIQGGDSGVCDAETARLVEQIGDGAFEDWYRERTIRRNIEQGQPYFNGPTETPSPERHSPGALLQCHRRRYYTQLNAPRERERPDGVYWFGSTFEEELIFDFFRDIASRADCYVRNDFWIDVEVETDTAELRIKGATDPVIVNRESEPLLLTEVKTKSSIENLTEPDSHHLAQAHAYQYGLTDEYGYTVDAVILYADKQTFETRVFYEQFDPDFWHETVIAWAEEHTEYRLNEELPPAAPVHGWECSFCDYAHRCGQADESRYSDIVPTGFLPGVDYPRESVVEYLRAHEDGELTPELARRYPVLADEFSVSEWSCEACTSTHAFEDVNWDGTGTPQCPSCQSRGVPASLVAPVPSRGGE